MHFIREISGSNYCTLTIKNKNIKLSFNQITINVNSSSNASLQKKMFDFID